MLVLQVPRQFLLVDLLHLVCLSEFLPLELVSSDFVDASEQLPRHVKPCLLSGLESLETYVAEPKQLVAGSSFNFDSPSHQLQTLNFTKLSKERLELLSQLFDCRTAIVRETFKVEVVTSQVLHKLEGVLLNEFLPQFLPLTLCHVEPSKVAFVLLREVC